jgi:hypothetical protein
MPDEQNLYQSPSVVAAEELDLRGRPPVNSAFARHTVLNNVVSSGFIALGHNSGKICPFATSARRRYSKMPENREYPRRCPELEKTIFWSMEGKRMASGLIRNQMPSNGLRVRPPCPPLLKHTSS